MLVYHNPYLTHDTHVCYGCVIFRMFAYNTSLSIRQQAIYYDNVDIIQTQSNYEIAIISKFIYCNLWSWIYRLHHKSYFLAL